MAMITIERIIPGSTQNQNHIGNNSGNNNNNNNNNDNNNSDNNQASESSDDSRRSSQNSNSSCSSSSNNNMTRSVNEIYIAVRGADIIFPHNECHRYSKNAHTTINELIQKHLEAILQLLRPQDMMKMAVRLESQLNPTRTRYLLVVSNETDQSCLLGIDYENEATIGLAVPIWNTMRIMLDGDGGFRITAGSRHHIFKPVSVQAMWSIFQALHLATKKSAKNNYYQGGGSHQWVDYYQNNIKSNAQCLHEWHTIVTDQTETNYNKVYEFTRSQDQNNFQEVITAKLKEVMVSIDLEQVTSKDIRNKLEDYFQRDLSEYKSFIDTEMIRIMGQLEEPSKILEYLYLGSEWNASNFEELKGKGVQRILNVTSEIDNYFPGSFDYLNIRVDDDEATNMLRHLNDTYYYIRKAKDEGVNILVHCKKGISRSASVVVAYIMKEKRCDLNEALQYVRNLRSSIRPNPAFLEQLEIYQGMLHASNNKNSQMWKSNSDSELQTATQTTNYDDESDNNNKITTNATTTTTTQMNKKNFFKNTRERMNAMLMNIGRKQQQEDKENNTFKFHRRKSWPPKNNSSSSSQSSASSVLFGRRNKENDGGGGANKSSGDSVNSDEIKTSRVKERIEDFENKQPTNQTKGISHLFKSKNLASAKNGIVSNLACQFEPKETTNTPTVATIQDMPSPSLSSNLAHSQQPDQQSRLMKPPIPPTSSSSLSATTSSKISKDDHQQHQSLNLIHQTNHQPTNQKYYTIEAE